MFTPFKCLILAFLLVLSIQPVAADSSAISNAVIDTAYQLVGENCQRMHRNQACYGHAQLVAEARLGYDSFAFENTGDIEDLVKIQSLRLSGLDAVAQTWGIALMQLRANLPDSAPENVTILAFGDVALENAVLPVTESRVAATAYANLRQTPSTEASVVASVAPGQVLTAVERLGDGTWMRVMLPQNGTVGWIFADLLSYENDIERLNVAMPGSTYYNQPMQAFVFESGLESPEFNELPRNGLLIQTPEGVGEVSLLINEVNIQLGSTVFFQAQAGGFMTISTIEGHADVRVDNIEFTAFTGSRVMVPLNEDRSPSGPPMPPQPYDMDAVEFLPYGLLQRPVEVGAPLVQSDIDALIIETAAQQSFIECPSLDCDTPGEGDACSGAACDAPGLNTCPDAAGNSCNAPGHTTCEDAPGQSCNAPGQGGSSPGNSGNSNRGGNGNSNGNGRGNRGGNGNN